MAVAWRAIGHLPECAEALRLQSQLLAERGGEGDAAELLGQAGEIYRSIGDRRGLAEVCRNTWHLVREEQTRMRALVEETSLRHELGEFDEEAACWLMQGFLHLLGERSREALAAAQTGLAVAEENQVSVRAQQLRELIAEIRRRGS